MINITVPVFSAILLDVTLLGISGKHGGRPEGAFVLDVSELDGADALG